MAMALENGRLVFDRGQVGGEVPLAAADAWTAQEWQEAYNKQTAISHLSVQAVESTLTSKPSREWRRKHPLRGSEQHSHRRSA